MGGKDEKMEGRGKKEREEREREGERTIPTCLHTYVPLCQNQNVLD